MSKIRNVLATLVLGGLCASAWSTRAAAPRGRVAPGMTVSHFTHEARLLLKNARQWARRLKRDVHALWLAGRDPRTPWYAEALAVAVAAYVLSPLEPAQGAASRSSAASSLARRLADRATVGRCQP